METRSRHRTGAESGNGTVFADARARVEAAEAARRARAAENVLDLIRPLFGDEMVSLLEVTAVWRDTLGDRWCAVRRAGGRKKVAVRVLPGAELRFHTVLFGTVPGFRMSAASAVSRLAR